MKTESILIRPASVADAPALAWFGATTFMATYAGAVSDDDLMRYVAENFTASRITSELTTDTTFVAESGRAIIGYALLRKSVAPGFVAGDDPLELGRLYVASTVQRQGIGSRLMAEAFDHAYATGHDSVWLTVWDRNRRAIAAYEQWGFQQVGTVGFPFGGVIQRDVVMARAVTRP